MTQAAIALVGLTVLARVVDPAGFGVLAVLNAALAILMVALVAGVQATVIVRSAASVGAHSAVNGLSICVGVAAVVPAIVVAGPLASPIAEATPETLAPVAVSMMFLRLPFMVYAGLAVTALSGAGMIRQMLALGVVGAISSLAAPLGAAASVEPVAGAAGGFLVGSAAWAAVCFAVAWAKLGVRWPDRSIVVGDVRHMTVPLHIGTVAYWIMLRADLFVVGTVLGGSSVGSYALAVSLAERASVLTSPAYSVAAWRIAGPATDQALRALKSVVRIELALATLLSGVGIVAGKPLVALVGGPGYDEAYLPLVFILPAAALLPVWSSAGLYLVAQADRAWTTAWVQVGMASASVVAYLIVVPTLGLAGAGLVSALAYVALAGIGVALVRQEHGFPWRDLLPTFQDLRSVVARALPRGSTRC